MGDFLFCSFSQYFLVWSENHFYGENTFPFTLLPNHTIFPGAVLVGQEAFAGACACSVLWDDFPAQLRGFGCGFSPSPVPSPEVLCVPVGWGALAVFTKLSTVAALSCSHPAGEYHQSRDLPVLHFPGPFASCPVGYFPLEGTFWPLHICRRH